MKKTRDEGRKAERKREETKREKKQKEGYISRVILMGSTRVRRISKWEKKLEQVDILQTTIGSCQLIDQRDSSSLLFIAWILSFNWKDSTSAGQPGGLAGSLDFERSIKAAAESYSPNRVSLASPTLSSPSPRRKMASDARQYFSMPPLQPGRSPGRIVGLSLLPTLPRFTRASFFLRKELINYFNLQKSFPDFQSFRKNNIFIGQNIFIVSVSRTS